MDPNANLTSFWEAYDNNRLCEALNLANDLCEWLGNGGFAPDWGDRGWDAWCIAHGHCDEYHHAYMAENHDCEAA